MLRFLVPDSLERLFFNLARQTPTEFNWLAFVALLSGFLVLLAFVLRYLLLRVDAELAVAARLRKQAPQSYVFAIGRIAVALPWIALGLALMMISAEGVFAMDRFGVFSGSATALDLIRGFADYLWR